jgi:glycogen synthase
VIFIGDGPDRMAIADKAQAVSHIKVNLGPWMPVTGVDQFLGVDDCLIMNSRWEGEPLVVREFTARGLPCVVRDIAGMRGVTNRSMRFSDADGLIGILKELHNAGSTKDYVHAARVPQARRLEILASLFETHSSH